jgi:hypothetical protein
MYKEIAILIVYLILSAELDAYRWRNKKKIDHNVNAAFRVMVGFAVLQNYLHMLVYLSSWWIIFDAYLNVRMGLPVSYIGKTAWLDKKLRKLGLNQFFVKFLILAASLTVNSDLFVDFLKRCITSVHWFL